MPARRRCPAPPDTSLVRRARKIDRVLAETYPDARCELDFDNPFELLVVTVLSAQTTDRRVNAVRPDAVRRLPRRRPRWPARRPRATSSRSSARSASSGPRPSRCSSSAQALVERYDGEVPGRLDDLVTLPGVGRKTANVVLGNAFGVPGITVDTHFGRLVRRLGWTEETDPVKVEHAIGALFPKRDWTMLSHHLIWHGRRLCHARKPACGACPVARWCPSYGEGPTDPVEAAEAGEDRRGRREASARARRGRLLLPAARCRPGPVGASTSTPRAARLKAEPASSVPPATATAAARRHPALLRRRRPTSTSARCAGRWWSTCGRPGAARAARRCRSSRSSTSSTATRSPCSASTTRTPSPRRRLRAGRGDRRDLPAARRPAGGDLDGAGRRSRSCGACPSSRSSTRTARSSHRRGRRSSSRSTSWWTWSTSTSGSTL